MIKSEPMIPTKNYLCKDGWKELTRADIRKSSSTNDKELPTLNPDLIPEPLLEYCRSLSESANVPLEFVLFPYFAFIGILLGTNLRMKVGLENDYLETANLWGMIIGEPSIRKSAGYDSLIKFIHNEIQKHLNKKHQDEMEKYKVEKAKYDGSISAIKNRKKSSTEVEIISEPKEPSIEKIIVHDVTSASLARLLSANARGLMIAPDELASLLTSLSKEFNSDLLNKLLTYWKGNTADSIDRKGIGASDFIEESAVSILGTIQPDVIESFCKKNLNSGFIQRFTLIIFPDFKPLPNNHIRKDKKVNKKAVERAFQIVKELSKIKKNTLSDYFPEVMTIDKYNKIMGKEHWIEYDEKAFDLANEYLSQKDIKASNSSNKMLSSHLGKYDKGFHGLCLIWYAIDTIDRHLNGKEKEGKITERIVKNVIALMAFLEAHATKFYDTFFPSIGLSLEEKIYNEIIKFGSKPNNETPLFFNFREIAQLKSLRKKKDKVLEILKDFEKLGAIKSEIVGKKTGGAINPYILEEVI